MRMSDWYISGCFVAALIFVLVFAKIIKRVSNCSPETIRKIVHITTGLLIAITPFFFQSKWTLLAIAGVFLLAVTFAVYKQWLPEIHGTARLSWGTVFYPASFIILVYFLWDHFKLVLITAMLILALADALAAIVGQNIKAPKMLKFGSDEKSIQGSITMFISTVVIVFACLNWYPLQQELTTTYLSRLWIAVLVGVIATACELVSYKGSDNLTVPLGSAFTLYYLVSHSSGDILCFSVGAILALLVAVISVKAGFLSPTGAVATFCLGTLVFGIGRIAFTIPILAFFILSSLLSKVGKNLKQNTSDIVEKGGCRDICQVFANGGVAGLLLLVWFFTENDIFYLLFVASLASVMADTWATEIGVFSKSTPRSVITFRHVPAGTSGGITLLGTLGAVLGALVLIGLSSLSGPHHSPGILGLKESVALLTAGIAACFLDSILGATVQAINVCPVCNKNTEKTIHCNGQETRHARGLPWMTNDVVNVLCAVSGAFIAYLLL